MVGAGRGGVGFDFGLIVRDDDAVPLFAPYSRTIHFKIAPLSLSFLTRDVVRMCDKYANLREVNSN